MYTIYVYIIAMILEVSFCVVYDVSAAAVQHLMNTHGVHNDFQFETQTPQTTSLLCCQMFDTSMHAIFSHLLYVHLSFWIRFYNQH